MEMRVGERVEGEKTPVETGPRRENEWEKETSLPHGERRGPYTERQWYDERIGGRPRDVERAGGERKIEKERAKSSGKEGKEEGK